MEESMMIISNQNTEMESVLSLLNDENTLELVERHVEVVGELSNQLNESGLAVDEIDTFSGILTSCKHHAEVTDFDSYKKCILSLVTSLDLPLREAKAYQIVRNPNTIANLLRSIANLLLVDSNTVKIAASKALLNIIKVGSLQNTEKTTDDNKNTMWLFFQRTIYENGIVEIIASAIKRDVEYLFSNDEDGNGCIDVTEYNRAYGAATDSGEQVAMVPVMVLVSELVKFRENALEFVRQQVSVDLIRVATSLQNFRRVEVQLMINILCTVLNHSYEHAYLSETRTTTRNELLDKYRNSNALYVLGSIGTFEMLKGLLEKMLTQGYKASDKMLRNELLIIATLLARREDNATYFNDSGLLELILRYAVSPELDCGATFVHRGFATSDKTDIEAKQLMWHFVKTLSLQNTMSRKIVADFGFVNGLLSYIDQTSPNVFITKILSPAQIRVVQMSVLDVLTSLVPIFQQKVSTWKLEQRLIDMMVDSQLRAISPRMLLENGEPDEDFILCILRLMLVAADHVFIKVPTSALKLETMTLRTSRNPCMVSTCSLLLAHQLRQDPAIRRLFRQYQGVETLIQLLDWCRNDVSIPESVLLSVLACTRTFLTASTKTQRIFQQNYGIDALLNLVDSNKSVKVHTLAMHSLSLVMGEPLSVEEFLAWKNPVTRKSALGLILDTWLKQKTANIVVNAEYPLRDTDHTEIALPQPPVLGKEGRLREKMRSAKSLDGETPREASNNESEFSQIQSCVFFIVNKIDPSLVDRRTLNVNQLVLWELVKDYDKLVQGSQWVSMRDMLAKEGIKPVYYDRAVIEKHITELISTAKNVQVRQQEALTFEEKLQESQDAKLFGQIIEQRDLENETRKTRLRSSKK